MGKPPNLIYHTTNFVKRHTIVFLLVVGAVHGLIYVFLIPPWQHYDEPVHFEYAWLIANRGGLPERGEYDQMMRRDVAASMIENDFYKNLGGKPNLISTFEPIRIGFSQTSDPPIYYQLVSIPLILLSGADITIQLLVGRLVSWALFILCILSAWGITKDLTQPKHPLRWMVPFSLALLPGFIDIMTAINNDVGTTAFFSLFLWGAVITIRHGLSWTRLILILGTAILCIFTKSTVYFVIPLIVITFVLAILRGNRRIWAYRIIGASSILLISTTLTWGEAIKWYRHAPYNYQTRFKNTSAPLGDYAFLFEVQEGKASPQISQVLSQPKLDAIRGKTITIGAWIWANSSLSTRVPILYDGEIFSTKIVDIGRKPKFHAIHVDIKEDVERIHVLLSPLTDKNQEDVNIYFDGTILAVGKYPTDIFPDFNDPSGQRGLWGEKPFENLLDNPSAERGGLNVRPRVDAFIQKLFPVNPSWALNSLVDWEKSAWYYKTTAANLIRTFWAKFGWGQVSLLGNKPYRVFGGVTFFGFVGAVGYILRRKNEFSWALILLFGLTIVFIWGAAIFRGVSSAFATNNRVFIPAARYAFPAIISTMMVLNIGWLETSRFIQKWTRIRQSYLTALYILFFIGLDVISILSILHYYNR